jgi:hypothetical protein
MDQFYFIVLSVAVVFLIILLTIIGILLRKAQSTIPFPPTSYSCPDYWQVSTDGSSCIVPQNGAINTGDNPINSNNTYGYNSSNGTVNFTDAGWAGSGSRAICQQKQWANQNGIIWNGVSNYNAC